MKELVFIFVKFSYIQFSKLRWFFFNSQVMQYFLEISVLFDILYILFDRIQLRIVVFSSLPIPLTHFYMLIQYV